MRCLSLSCAAVVSVLLSFLAPLASAQNDTAPIRVQSVKFNNNVNPTKDSAVVIQLRAQNQPNPAALNKDYIDNIRVVVTLAYKHARSTSETDLIFYRSEVQIATMKVGDSRSTAFWLPYDIVTRDRYGREADYWVVELFVGEQAVPPNRDQVSRSLMKGNDPVAILNGFKSMAGAKVEETDGILRPTYLTINSYPERPDKIFPYIRKQENAAAR